MFRVPTDHGNEGEEEKPRHESDLAAGEPELAFAVDGYGKDIDENIKHDAASTDGGNGDVIAPVGKDEAQCRDLKRNDKPGIEEEIPPNGKAEGIVHPMAGHADEAATDRHVGHHLGHAIVHHGQEDVVNSKPEEQAARAALVQNAANAHKQGRTNGASNGSELYLTIGQGTV